ncbi:extracellular solute-binding protein [Dellaglioa sp. L3N]
MKKSLSLVSMLILFLVMLSGCSNDGKVGTGSKENPIELKLWVDLNQAKGYQKIVDQYIKENSDRHIQIKIIESESGKALENLSKDPESAADVFVIPHDQLGQLVDSGMVYKSEKFAKQEKKANSAQSIAAGTYKNQLYGYPASVESMFLYYDKSVFSKNDIQSFEGMMAKSKVGLNLSEAGADFRIAPWFIANGAQLFGKNGEDLKKMTYNSKDGVDVLKYIANLRKNKNVVSVNADELDSLKSGKIHALFSGVYNAEAIKEILGKNFGTAVYPTANFGDGNVNLKAFLSVRQFVVNADTKQPLESMKLAKYITNKQSQLKLSESLGTIPSNKIAQSSKIVLSDPVKTTVIDMSQSDHSVLTPKISQMSNFWIPINAIINDAYNGKIPENKMQSKLDQLVKEASSDSLK